jgi:seryl-tRNA synthetase
MLDVNLIRKDPLHVKNSLAKKKVDPKLIDKFLRLDEEWRLKTKTLDDLKAEQKNIGKKISQNKEDDKDLISKAQFLKQRINELEEEKILLENKRNEILEKLPNLPFDDVPQGNDENDNKVLREVGEKRKFDFKPLDYLTLGEKLGIIEVKKAGEVSGTRFGYLMNDAVLLEFALIKLAFDTILKENFIPVIPPVMIKPEVYKEMGRLSPEQKEDKYYIPKDDLYLVGSSEHTLGPLARGRVLNEEDLPLRFLGFSTCFRREAGSYGKDTKGILRVHQFDKVEMYSFVKPEDSEKEHLFLLSLQEKLMQKLKIPYRVVEICTGDMGFTDARQFDIEAWLPGQGENGLYRETHSSSNTTDFQTRGINAKFKDKEGNKNYLHALNATAFAIGRTIIAIIENYQTKNGEVEIPEVLRDYIGKDKIKFPSSNSKK